IARILLVNLRRHSHERSINLASRNDAVPQPVSDMLRRYAQGCAILYQTDIVNIRYLRTADSLLDPADNIAEDSLHIIVKLGPDLVRGPVRVGCHRDRQQRLERCDLLRSPRAMAEIGR